MIEFCLKTKTFENITNNFKMFCEFEIEFVKFKQRKIEPKIFKSIDQKKLMF